MNKRQLQRDQLAQSKAVAKQELLAPVAEQRYTMTSAEADAKLRSHSTSPDLSATIKLIRTIKQLGLVTDFNGRQMTEFDKALINVIHTQCAIIVVLGSVCEDFTLVDFGRAVIAETREVLKARAPGSEVAAIESLTATVKDILARPSLAKANKPELITIDSNQLYDAGDLKAIYEQASPTIDVAADLQLCRYFIQQAFDERDWDWLLRLWKNESKLAMIRLNVGKSCGALVSLEAAGSVTKSIIGAASATIKEFCTAFEPAIDELRDRLMLCFPGAK